MIGLIKNELYKFLKQKKLYLFMGVIVVVQLVNVLQARQASHLLNGQSFPLEALAESSLYITMFLAVFIAETIAEEYKRGMFKVVLLRPINRSQFICAKSMGVLVCICFMVCFTILTAYGIGSIFFSWGDHMLVQGNPLFLGGNAVMFTLTTAFAYILPVFGFAMLIFFIALLSLNVGITIGTALSLFMFAPLLKGSIQAYSIVHIMNTFPALFINQTAWQEILFNIGIILAYIILFYIGSLLFIKRKDVLV